MDSLPRMLVAFFGLFASSAAIAHTGIHPEGSLATGLIHPFLGLDHLLAMVAVGVWAVQLGGRYLLIVPAIFVVSMAAGAIVGALGVAAPHVENGVALSVLVLGLLVTLSVRAAWYWAVSLITVFALFHGHAHGTEIPAFSQQWQYFLGFLITTVLLHAFGVAAGIMLKRRPVILRTGGAAISLLGAWLVLAN